MNFQLDVLIIAIAVLACGAIITITFILTHLCGYYLVDHESKNALIEFKGDPVDISRKRVVVMLVSEADLPDDKFVNLSDEDYV
jgi:hypothetical protein